MTSSSKLTSACALGILLCIATLSFWSTVRGEKDRAWVTHTHLVIEKIQEVRIDITQAETSQRRYLLAGDEKYLESCKDDVNQVLRDIGELRRLTADNPRQADAIKGLQPIVDGRIALLVEQMEIRKQFGSIAAAEAPANVNGEELMNEIRKRAREMREAEMQLLTQRMETAATATWRMKAVIVVGNALAILILLAAGFVIHRETGKRNLAEQDLLHVNERLERRTVELSETNIELETFAYSVAHDLRAPLRHISGYSQLLAQDYAPHLDAEGQRCLQKIAEGTRKMGRLVDDLLGLSKIGRQELSLQTTPLDSLLQQVVEDLVPECSGREIDWRIGYVSSAECDPALMKQVFVNLLSNAVKYTGKREHAVIQIGQMMKNGRRVIFVRDNGVGFEMQYAGQLFGVFQRLHKARDFEGTGVGLAIVQRIIRKHGGEIWAEAEVDKGATFFFTLGSQNTASNKQGLPIEEGVTYAARS